MFKPGDLAYFKKAKKSSHIKQGEVAFKGLGFGVMLGILPPFGKEPTPQMCMKLMGTIGFVSFDDIAEFLGNESGEKCVKLFEDKYYGKVIEIPAASETPNAITSSHDLSEDIASVRRIIDTNGNPL